MPRLAPLLLTATLASAGMACSDDAPSTPEVLFEFDSSTQPGAIVGLVAVDGAGGRTIEWVHRLDGTIHSLDIDDPESADVVGEIEVGTDGEQRGLLGQVAIDGRRFASWTSPEHSDGSFDLVVGEVTGDGQRSIWSAPDAGGGAIGGVLAELDGDVLLGIGRNTGFDAETGTGGAFVQIDPDGPVDQTGDVLSVGYTNPWAFTVTGSNELWFADNAAGPDPDDASIDDIERTGRGDLIDDRNDVPRITTPGRAPTSMIELPDGRIGICGFLDNELRAYEIVDTDAGARSGLDRAGTIMPCLTSAAIFDDGTIVTVAGTDTGQALHILRP